MKKLSTLVICLFAAITIFGQKYYTKEGHITFYSDAPLEKIEAVNKRVTAVIDFESGKVEFALLIKAFRFEKALMEEHFNENYMESDKYPKAIFRGMIDDLKGVDMESPGTYPVKISGELTIREISNPVELEANLVVDDEGIGGMATFAIACEDYKIKIPKVVIDNIAKEIEVNVDARFQPLVK